MIALGADIPRVVASIPFRKALAVLIFLIRSVCGYGWGPNSAKWGSPVHQPCAPMQSSEFSARFYSAAAGPVLSVEKNMVASWLMESCTGIGATMW